MNRMSQHIPPVQHAKMLPRLWSSVVLTIFLAMLSALSVLTIASQPLHASERAEPKAVDKRQEALYVEADELNVDRPALKSTFTGSVVARQGKREIRADRIEVFYVEQNNALDPTVIKAFGNVFYFGETIIAENADTGVFDVRAQTINLQGNLKLLQGENAIYGTGANINLETGQAIVTGNKENKSRVRGSFAIGN